MAELVATGDFASANDHRKGWFYRYPIVVRLTHWINASCLVILFMSGLQIFNAHPALYWGQYSDFERPFLSIHTAFTSEGRPVGMTRIFGRSFETTGVLGWSRFNGRPAQRAFPAWITIPGAQDLATGRVWHFFFAWVLVFNGVLFLTYSFLSGHLSRDLLPRREQWNDIGSTLREHLMLKLRHSRDAHYNVIQRLVYLIVILLLGPLMVLTGLAMSPAIGAAAPWLLDVFGGRQSARTIHFIVTWSFVLFIVIHVVMVVLSGFINNMRSMITGWYSGEVSDHVEG
jgi:thiosulfate reductase cytochrome b subunit